MQRIDVPFEKLHKDARVPCYGSLQAAGADLFHADHQSITINPGKRKLIKTGIAMAIPEGYYGRIAPRSGAAYKNGIDVLAGVIDCDYRGDVGVILINFGEVPVYVHPGDRIAQIIFERCEQANFSLIQSGDSLPKSRRGHHGFGSTGT